MKIIIYVLLTLAATNEPLCMDERQYIDLFGKARNKILAETGIELVPKQINTIQDDPSKVSDGLLLINRINVLRFWSLRSSSNRINTVLLPPIDGTYMAGMADTTCIYKRRRRNPTISVQVKASKPEHSLTALVHELGHALGAEHDDSEHSVMHSAAIGLTDSGVYFSKKSKNEIRRCMNFGRRNKGNE